MLLLSRKENQSIILEIGTVKVTILVTEISQNNRKVRLGIDAPKDVLIVREELLKGDKR